MGRWTNGCSDQWVVGQIGFPTNDTFSDQWVNGFFDQWVFGPMDRWTNDIYWHTFLHTFSNQWFSNQWHFFGSMGHRTNVITCFWTNASSDQWTVRDDGLMFNSSWDWLVYKMLRTLWILFYSANGATPCSDCFLNHIWSISSFVTISCDSYIYNYIMY